MYYKALIGLLLALGVFMSGKLPYTLIYNADQLASVPGEGDAITGSELSCDVQLSENEVMVEGTFTLDLTNNTDRFVIVSVVGELLPPKGYGIPSYQKRLFNPEESQHIKFNSSIPFGPDGEYLCEVRYVVGWDPP